MKKALLVSTYQGAASLIKCKESLKELTLLTETMGADPVFTFPCQLRKVEAATFLTKGKIEEILALRVEHNADIVVLDEEIAPSQQRNLEEILGVPVLDRTEVILEVFVCHAKTKEAKLQIEMAKTHYEAPRLKRLWTHLSRQTGGGASSGGGGAYTKGEGEKQIEIDRRILKDKIHKLNEDLKDVKKNRETLRQARIRQNVPSFAIVGYTNAGKSTLMNALTDAGVFVEDKLFATLDTTTRQFKLKTGEEIVVIDTVGFIKKLPHLLIEAFKSTLEEALSADILLHLIDVSNPQGLEQGKTTLEVLKELHADHKPIITVLNKIDLLEHETAANRYKLVFPNCVPISALNHTGFDELQDKMLHELSKTRKRCIFRIPQKDYKSVAEMKAHGNVIKEEYEENDILVEAELPNFLFEKFKSFQADLE